MPRISFRDFPLTGHLRKEQIEANWDRRMAEAPPGLTTAQAVNQRWFEQHGWCPSCYGWVVVWRKNGQRCCPWCSEEVKDER